MTFGLAWESFPRLVHTRSRLHFFFFFSLLLYYEYTGICKLGEKLGMDDPTEDIRILVLLWKMMIRDKPSQMSFTEWMAGCTYLEVDSWEKFRTTIIPTLDTGFLETSEFKDFYKFCFIFSRQGTHKSLDMDLVVALLPLVLLNTTTPPTTTTTTAAASTTATTTTSRRSSARLNNKAATPSSSSSAAVAVSPPAPVFRVSAHRVQTFCAFLEQSSYTHITLDQWTSFLDFALEMDEDLSHYDESTSAWPVILDEYVEYMEQQMKKQSQGDGVAASATTMTTT